MKRLVRTRRGRTVLMQREASGLHPSWQFRPILNQQKVTPGEPPLKKMLKMKVDPTMCMKTLETRAKCPTKWRAFVPNRSRFCRKSGIMKANLPGIALFGRDWNRFDASRAALRVPAHCYCLLPTAFQPFCGGGEDDDVYPPVLGAALEVSLLATG